jgi:hypothetical protein
VDFPNPYRTDGARKPSPGEVALFWANFFGTFSQLAGVSLTVQETEALATVINAILRSYPRLREMAVDLGTKEEHKE